jgi:hypothetical protein
MLGVTLFGLLLTPVFYVLVRRASHHAQADLPGLLAVPEVSHE